MTEQEAIVLLQENVSEIYFVGKHYDAIKMAVSALEEIQRYREIGTVKELQELKEISFSGLELAGIAAGMMRLKKYEEIGTVEECQEAREKQKAKKPVNARTSGFRYTDTYRCPSCNGRFSGTGIADHCYHCGQRLDWDSIGS